MSDLHALLTTERKEISSKLFLLQAQLELIDKVLASREPLSSEVPPDKASEAKPSPKESAPKSAGDNHRVLTFQDVAQHLADGPKGIGYLRDKLRSDPKTIKKCLEKHNLLFRKAYPLDRLSPWELTDEGRRELAG